VPRGRRNPVNNEERARIVRQLTQQAIQSALDSRWDDAVQMNRELLKIVQPNPETLNRLAKALSELGRYGEAKKTYSDSLQLDPDNTIARKNIDRLSLLGDESPVGEGTPGERIDPHLFIEELGKTGVTSLVNLAPPPVLAKVSAGDQVHLSVDGHALLVQNARGQTLGQVEPFLANRLIKFMAGGNQYVAAITELTEREVRIIIRETFQHPTQLGKVSFPALGAGSLPRADIRHTLVRDRDDETEFDEEEDDDFEDEAEDDAEAQPEETEGGDAE
jgi:tetratricopeptide (TPR) repeat protein